MGINFAGFNRTENSCLLAIFDRKKIVHLGAGKIARFCRGTVKVAPQLQRIARFWSTRHYTLEMNLKSIGSVSVILGKLIC